MNPIELIWVDVKQWVASRNVSFKNKDVEMLCRERFDQVGQIEWEKVCHQIEQEYWEKDGLMEERIERIIIEDNRTASSDENNDSNSDTTEDEDMSGIEELQCD